MFCFGMRYKACTSDSAESHRYEPKNNKRNRIFTKTTDDKPVFHAENCLPTIYAELHAISHSFAFKFTIPYFWDTSTISDTANVPSASNCFTQSISTANANIVLETIPNDRRRNL